LGEDVRIKPKQLDPTPLLTPAPTLTWVSGAGSAAALTGVTFIAISRTVDEVNYRCTFTWNAAVTNAQVLLRLNNVPSAKLSRISFGIRNAASQLIPDQVAFALGTTAPEVVFRNNVTGPLNGLIYFSVAR
jgi:hypothetical protein